MSGRKAYLAETFSSTRSRHFVLLGRLRPINPLWKPPLSEAGAAPESLGSLSDHN